MDVDDPWRFCWFFAHCPPFVILFILYRIHCPCPHNNISLMYKLIDQFWCNLIKIIILFIIYLFLERMYCPFVLSVKLLQTQKCYYYFPYFILNFDVFLFGWYGTCEFCTKNPWTRTATTFGLCIIFFFSMYILYYSFTNQICSSRIRSLLV